MTQYDAFQRKLLEIKKALDGELYNCALAVALTLPDICGKIEFSNAHSSKIRYESWFNKYALQFFTVKAEVLPGNYIKDFVKISAEECYKLRCAVLHAGNYDVEEIELKNVLIYANKREGKPYSYMHRNNTSAKFDVYDICENLCLAAEQYYNGVKDKTLFSNAEVISYVIK